MATVTQHYSELLAPIYLWIVGGAEAAFARGESELASLCTNGFEPAVAIDLGAGFGMHTIPLARRGCEVIAVDSSALLLEELERQAKALPVRTECADLVEFFERQSTRADFVLCMGDTLTHLNEFGAVERIISAAKRLLRPGGRIVVTFRDYSQEVVAEKRFIPVRSDESRILTCFLEYSDRHVKVHDILHERTEGQWSMTVSSYEKLRLAPCKVLELVQENEFEIIQEPGLSGMTRIIGTRT